MKFRLTALELCAGGGGQSLGIEQAGFELVAAVEIEPDMCATLRTNRSQWNVLQADLNNTNGAAYRGVTLVAAGVPCPPFSIAGKQLGHEDERDLFPAALNVIKAAEPMAVMLENVRGFAASRFDDYRQKLHKKLQKLGYYTVDAVLNASSYGVPQLRPRYVLVGVPEIARPCLEWPPPEEQTPPTIAEAIGDLMSSNGWPGAADWMKRANAVAPTIVGGSKKHGGPDLGPTRAKRQWAILGVDGHGVANTPPDKNTPKNALPKLTVRMTARLQGFPDDWVFVGKKTSSYRQIGNAFPPPVARAVALSIYKALEKSARLRRKTTALSYKSNQLRFEL